MPKGEGWTVRDKPQLDHLLSLASAEPLPIFIVGHLIVEALLAQLHDLKLPAHSKGAAFDCNFPKKLELCLHGGLIDQSMVDFLTEMNRTRNKYAHRLGFRLSFDDVFALLGLAAKAGVDFSDDTIHRDRALSEAEYGLTDALTELFSNTAQELAWILHENGEEFSFV